MEVLWTFYGGSMNVLWKFYGNSMGHVLDICLTYDTYDDFPKILGLYDI
jgi:hypothetical protein